MSLVHPPLHSVHLTVCRPSAPDRNAMAFVERMHADLHRAISLGTEIVPGMCSGAALNSQLSTLNCGVGAPAPRRR